MKKTFQGYYLPSEEEFKAVWDSCIFVLDASVLLNLYRYSQETRESFVAILEEIGGRLWVPHQAALEYQRNRLGVIEEQASAYDHIKAKLSEIRNKLDNELRSFKRHPSIKADALLGKLGEALSSAERELNELSREHPDYAHDDPIRDRVTLLLDGRVGAPYTAERITEICKEGKARYESKTPPGYADMAKGGPDQYGDVILWMQVIEKAKELRKPVILVTDDRKEDWWLRSKGETLGPRPELLQEIVSKAGVSSYIYSGDPFMEHAVKYLKHQVKAEAIDEVKGIRQREEQPLLDGLTSMLQDLASPTKEMKSVFAQLANPTEDMRRIYQQLAHSSDELRSVARELAPHLAAIQRVLETLPPGFWEAFAAAAETRDLAASTQGAAANRLGAGGERSE